MVTRGKVTEVRTGSVLVEGNDPVALDEVFWTTRAAPAEWLANTGLALDSEGFIRVAETLQSVSHPHVFAAGDIASIDGHARPKSGVYAVRSGPPLAGNLRRMLEGRRLVSYRPQREALYLISTGERYALGARNGFTFEGAWVWTLKDFIDRRFMAKFNALPQMPTAAAGPVPAIADAAAITEISEHPAPDDPNTCRPCAQPPSSGQQSAQTTCLQRRTSSWAIVGRATERRDRQAIADDIADGYVTREAAQRDYGWVLDQVE